MLIEPFIDQHTSPLHSALAVKSVILGPIAIPACDSPTFAPVAAYAYTSSTIVLSQLAVGALLFAVDG